MKTIRNNFLRQPMLVRMPELKSGYKFKKAGSGASLETHEAPSNSASGCQQKGNV